MSLFTKSRAKIDSYVFPGDRLADARRLTSEFLAAERKLFELYREQHVNTMRANATLTSHRRHGIRDGYEELCDKANRRVLKRQKAVVAFIFRVTKWDGGLLHPSDDPTDWPSPAIRIDDVIWAVRVVVVEKKGLPDEYYPGLIRIELADVVTLDAPPADDDEDEG